MAGRQSRHYTDYAIPVFVGNSVLFYEGWNYNSGNYLFTTDTK